MFNLEQSIAEWRRQMLVAGIKPESLDELEGHLREEIERQLKLKVIQQQAFEMAVKAIGRGVELKNEFKKAGEPMEMQRIIKLAGVSCVAVALFFPLGICFRSCLHLMFDHQFSLITRALPFPVLAITCAITVLSWKYNHKLLPVIRNQRLRRILGVACFAGCMLWMQLALFYLPMGVITNIPLLAFLFGLEWTVFAILGGAGHGLEKAACDKSTALGA